MAGAQPHESLALALYVYDRQKSGLVCVFSVDAKEIEDNWEAYFFKPGRGVAGTSFRRRSVEVSPPIESDQERLEPIRDERPPELVLCIPLFYGNYTERAMAVLSFESKAPSSELKEFASKREMLERVSKHFAGWYKEGLAPAVGVHSTHGFWNQKMASGK